MRNLPGAWASAGVTAGANIAKSEHRCAVGDDTNEIGTRGVPGGRRRIFDNRIAGSSNTRGVGQREVALIGQPFGRTDGNFAEGWG